MSSITYRLKAAGFVSKLGVSAITPDMPLCVKLNKIMSFMAVETASKTNGSPCATAAACLASIQGLSNVALNKEITL